MKYCDEWLWKKSLVRNVPVPYLLTALDGRRREKRLARNVIFGRPRKMLTGGVSCNLFLTRHWTIKILPSRFCRQKGVYYDLILNLLNHPLLRLLIIVLVLPLSSQYVETHYSVIVFLLVKICRGYLSVIKIVCCPFDDAKIHPFLCP
jgi:hypothetical protein